MAETVHEQNKRLKSLLRRARKHVDLSHDCCDIPHQSAAYGRLLNEIDTALRQRPTTSKGER